MREDLHDSKNINKLHPSFSLVPSCRSTFEEWFRERASTYRIERPCTNEQESGRRRRKERSIVPRKKRTKHCRGCRLHQGVPITYLNHGKLPRLESELGPNITVLARGRNMWGPRLLYLASCSAFLCSVLPCAIPICFTALPLYGCASGSQYITPKCRLLPTNNAKSNNNVEFLFPVSYYILFLYCWFVISES